MHLLYQIYTKITYVTLVLFLKYLVFDDGKYISYSDVRSDVLRCFVSRDRNVDYARKDIRAGDD